MKIWRLLKRLYGNCDAGQVFATYVEEELNERGSQRNAVVPNLYWSATLEAVGVHWGDDSSFAFQMTKGMREVFKLFSVNASAMTFFHLRSSGTGRWLRTLKVPLGRTIGNTHWQWLTGLVSTVRSNLSKRSGTSPWLLVRKRWVKVCVAVHKTQNKTYPWLAQWCTLDKTDQKRNLQGKKQRDSCPVPRVLRSVCPIVCATRAQQGFPKSRNAK